MRRQTHKVTRCDPISVECPQQVDSQTERGLVSARGWEGVGGTAHMEMGLLLGDETFWKWTEVGGTLRAQAALDGLAVSYAPRNTRTAALWPPEQGYGGKGQCVTNTAVMGLGCQEPS